MLYGLLQKSIFISESLQCILWLECDLFNTFNALVCHAFFPLEVMLHNVLVNLVNASLSFIWLLWVLSIQEGTMSQLRLYSSG
jgi:hypothetical protein